MLPQTHLIFGAIFSLILYAQGYIDLHAALIIAAASFLIDTDHWLIYVFEKKSLSISKSYQHFYKMYVNKQRRRHMCVFHTIEAYVIALLLGLKYPFFMYVFVGMLFHLFLDLIKAVYEKAYTREISIIYWLIRKKIFVQG